MVFLNRNRACVSVTVVALCLLLGPAASLAAIATIDVGAAAVGNEWRPVSCDAVKDGVVLTNIAANVKAVIEGCTITLPSGSASSTAAVTAAAFSAGASLEIRSCTVTAPFQSAGYAIRIAGLGHGSGFVINNSTVSVTGTIVGAVTVISSTSNDVFVKVLNASTLTSVASSRSMGFYFDAKAQALGERTVLSVEDSLFDVHCTSTGDASALMTEGPFGHGASLTTARSRFLANGGSTAPIRATSKFGNNCSVLISDCFSNATSTTGKATALTVGVQDQAGLYLSVQVVGSTLRAFGASNEEVHGIFYRPGLTKEHSFFSVVDSTVVAMGSDSGNVYGINMRDNTFESNSSVSVSRSTVNASGQSYSFGIQLAATRASNVNFAFVDSNFTATSSDSLAFGFVTLSSTLSNTRLSFERTLVHATAETKAAACVLLYDALPTATISVKSSVFEFRAETVMASIMSGAISTQPSVAWTDVTLTVADTKLVMLPGTKASATPRFVHWPNTITGMSPQRFDRVTLTAPADLPIDAPFVANDGTYSGNTTICLSKVEWGNGTQVPSSAGPGAFVTPAVCLVTDTPAVTPSLRVTRSPPMSSTRSLSPPPTPTIPRSATPTNPRSATLELVTPAPTSVPETPAPTPAPMPSPSSSSTSAAETPAPATSSSDASGTPAPSTPVPGTPVPGTPSPTPAPRSSSSSRARASSSASSAASASSSAAAASSAASASAEAPTSGTPTPGTAAPAAGHSVSSSTFSPTPGPQVASSRTASSSSSHSSTKQSTSRATSTSATSAGRDGRGGEVGIDGQGGTSALSSSEVAWVASSVTVIVVAAAVGVAALLFVLWRRRNASAEEKEDVDTTNAKVDVEPVPVVTATDV